MIARRAVLAACAAAFGCARKKAAGFPGYAFVANEEGQAVAAVDLETFTLARRIPVDGRPTAVIAHPARDAVYVLTPDTGAVHEIVASSLALRRRMRAAGGAISMRLSADGETLWLLAGVPPQLVRIDTERLETRARIALPWKPADFDLSRDGRLCAVSFGVEGAVSIFEPAVARAGAPIRAAKAAGILRFRSDGRHLLVGDTAENALVILEAPSGRLVTRLPLAVRPDNLCFKADGGQLFVTGAGMDAVVVVYPYSTEVAQTILAGHAPGAMAASIGPGDGYLFVANPPSGDVTVVDIETSRAIAKAAVGADPGCITVTPDDQFALVLNRGSGNLAVLRIRATAPRRTRSAPLFTVIPVGSRPVSAAVKAVG